MCEGSESNRGKAGLWSIRRHRKFRGFLSFGCAYGLRAPPLRSAKPRLRAPVRSHSCYMR